MKTVSPAYMPATNGSQRAWWVVGRVATTQAIDDRGATNFTGAGLGIHNHHQEVQYTHQPNNHFTGASLQVHNQVAKCTSRSHWINNWSIQFAFFDFLEQLHNTDIGWVKSVTLIVGLESMRYFEYPSIYIFQTSEKVWKHKQYFGGWHVLVQ